ncbi:hypothetical protein FLL45_16000 [Aliikangiella marina]|uniref:DUF1418 family protein n=1 Tax=Aliikangiella marina TaxID=1712262 RepID=A0A545T705_9GAMM|nr:hypothetical protein [Aliikangiella marina]TQV72965.1 hypothetical protein FLL45_16000 [Aliikangiella marina]
MKIPPLLVLLDVIGMVFIGIGLADYFGAIDWLPQSIRFEFIGFVLIFLGFLMTTPLIVWVIKNGQNSKGN